MSNAHTLTKKQERYVCDNYMTSTYKEMAKVLKVPREWLWLHAKKKLGLRRGRWGTHCWSEQEKAVMREYFGKVPKVQLLLLLPKRKWPAVLHMAQRMKLTHSLAVEFADQLKPVSLTPAEAAYIAGVMDGEGCLSLLKVSTPPVTGEKKLSGVGRPPRQRHDPRFHIMIGVGASNDDPKMMEFIRTRCGGRIEIRVSPTGKKHFVWKARGFRALPFLEAIRDFMVTKQAAADMLISYLKLRLSKPKNAPVGPEEWTLYSRWRKLCPLKGSPDWASRYST